MSFRFQTSINSYNSGLLQQIKQRKNQKRIAIFTLFFMLFQVISPFASFVKQRGANASSIVIKSPYKNYNYNYKGNLHAHTSYGPADSNPDNNDDGSEARASVGQWYADHGFAFYALTGHYAPFYNYTDASYQQNAVTNPLDAKLTIVPNPTTSGIIWMGNSIENSVSPIAYSASNEDWKKCAHVGQVDLPADTFGTSTVSGNTEIIGDTTKLGIRNAQQLIDNVYASGTGGLNIFNHPYYNTDPVDGGTCTGQVAVNVIKGLNNLSGIEIYNSSVIDRQNPADATTTGVGTAAWDEILNSGRMLYAFAGDDGHSVDARGKAFVVVNSNSSNPDKSELMNNIKSGNFIASTPIDPLGTANNNYYNLNISVSGDTITASTTNGSKIRWIQDGVVVKTTSASSDTLVPSGSAKYVRVEVLDASDYPKAWSQPLEVTTPPASAYVGPAADTVYPVEGAGASANVSLSASAADTVMNHHVVLKVVYRKSSDGGATWGNWTNFGTTNSSGPGGALSYPNNIGSNRAYLINNQGWVTDKADGTALDFSVSPSGTTFTYPTVGLTIGKYEWAVQSEDEIRGSFSTWITGRYFSVVDSTTYTVTFDANGGSIVSSTTGISSGAMISAPTAPTKSGYTFAGWYKDSGLTDDWNFSTDTVTSDVTLYAKWSQDQAPTTYSVTFDSNGGSSVSSTTGVISGTTISAPTAPTKSGYTFAGWYKDAGLTDDWNFGTDTVTGDTTLYAKWSDNSSATYTVTLDANDGVQQAQLTGIVSGSTLDVPPDPARAGYTFVAWFKDSGLTDDWNFTTDTVTSDITLYAKWTQNQVPTTYTVTFNSNGGSSVSSKTGVNSGVTITAPTAPTKSGYTFVGWYKDAGLTDDWNFGTDTVASNVTLYAKWATVETADFNSNTKTASKSGATVSFSDNTKLPSNLSSGLNLTVQNGSTQTNPEGKSIVGSYEVTVNPAPTGSYLATVALNYPTGTTWKEGDTVMYWNGSAWSSVGITVTSHTSSSVTFTTTHFTEFGIVTAASSGTTNTTTASSLSGLANTLPTTGANVMNILLNLLLAIACYAGLVSYIKKTKYSKILA